MSATVYVEDDGTVVYRASGLGSCPRALVAARQGIPPHEPDGATSQVMAEGDLHESDILQRLTRSGYSLLGRAQEVVELELWVGPPRVIVRGHIDEIVETSLLGKPVVVDAKAMSDSAWHKWCQERWDARPGIKWQISVYMHALNMPGLIAAKNRNSGQLDLYRIPEPPIGLTQIKHRVDIIEHAANSELILPCADGESWFCRYPQLHDGYTPRSAAEGAPMAHISSPDFEALCGAYNRARERAVGIDRELQDLDRLIRKWMGDEKEVDTPKYNVSIRQSSRKYLKAAKVRKLLSKEQIPEVEETSVSDNLTVRPKGSH